MSSVASGSVSLVIAAILYGIGFGSAQPAMQAAIIRLVPPNRVGMANASFSTATDLGIGLGAMLFGWISNYTSYQLLFIVSALSVVLSFLCFQFLVKKIIVWFEWLVLDYEKLES
ncbi:MFS transporter [Lysinibacillus piscis]|uniref:MFS transporter n=1 Tax=Lysinibacillus piscis TaxID=2518931 RepID=UPI0022300274|nr:MFS transporter [Lysinibacillus sp. KH24]